MRATRQLSVLLALLASCASDPAPGTTPSGASLCEGGMKARLTYLVDGGQVEPDFPFYGAYGHASFVIDGDCRFWVGREPLGGLSTGQLAAAQAAEFAAKLHWAALPELSKQRDVESCPDAGASLIGDGTHVIDCTCGCDVQLPAATKDAFANVEEIHRSLTAMSSAFEGPLRAASRRPPPEEEKKASVDPRLPAWTLPFSPADLAIEGSSARRDSGKAIDSAGDRAALRALRASAGATPGGGGFLVRTMDGAIFRVYLRDEAPDHVLAGLAVH